MIKPLVSDTMLLFEGYTFNVQMHVILDALSKLDVNEKKNVFRRKARVERYYKPRNRLWAKLQSMELKKSVKEEEIETCEKYWNSMTKFVEDYVTSALDVYSQATIEDTTNQDAKILTEHAKWN